MRDGKIIKIVNNTNAQGITKMKKMKNKRSVIMLGNRFKEELFIKLSKGMALIFILVFSCLRNNLAG